MKFITSIIILLTVLKFSFSQAKDTLINSLPNIELKKPNGTSINAKDFANKGKPFVICFWKTCCKSTLKMLDDISDNYSDWVKEADILLYAISIDDSRSSQKVLPLASSRGWEFIILLDINSDLKRAMNIINTPHILIFNGQGNLVWQKSLFSEGDEDIIFEELKKLSQNDEKN